MKIRNLKIPFFLFNTHARKGKEKREVSKVAPRLRKKFWGAASSTCSHFWVALTHFVTISKFGAKLIARKKIQKYECRITNNYETKLIYFAQFGRSLIASCMSLVLPVSPLFVFQPQIGMREAGAGEDRDPATVHHGEIIRIILYTLKMRSRYI